MADIILNGGTFSGAPGENGTPSRPSSINVKIRKIGAVREAVSGSRTFVHRGFKNEWSIAWDDVTETTRLAVAIVASAIGTFTFTDTAGSNYTVHLENEDHEQETIYADADGNQHYRCALTLREV